MAHTMTRRAFAAGTALVTAGGVAGFPPFTTLVSAAHRGGHLEDLGLPALNVTVTADGFEGLPAELAAGRYLLTTSLADGVEFGAAGFASPPAGMTAEQLLEAIGGGAAAPSGSPEAAAPEEMGAPPAFVYQARFAGGAIASPAGPGQAVIDLGPGGWILWSDDPVATQKPRVFTVTGEMPADIPEPEADIAVGFVDFGIEIGGALTAGEHLLRIENRGAQPHFLIAFSVPEGTTNDDIAAMLEAEMSGAATPAAGMEDVPALVTVAQSIGTVAWIKATLEPGTYAGLCFIPTAGTGLPHAMMGMHTVFTVS